jgi:hypothetical protein
MRNLRRGRDAIAASVEDGSGIGSPSARMPAKYSSIASRISRSHPSRAAAAARQPGGSSIQAH